MFVGRGGEERTSQPLPALWPPIYQPIAQRYTTELSTLLIRQYNADNIYNIYLKHFFDMTYIW